MNKISVCDRELEIKEYDGKRVVTFKDIDEVHRRREGTAKNNFQKNRKHFVENEDYYIVKKELLKVVKSNFYDIPSRGLTVLTETGYLMLVKTFRDDLSWEVQRRLVNAYFSAKETEAHPDNEELLEAPRQKNWYLRNKLAINTICQTFGISYKYFISQILEFVGTKYDIDEARMMFRRKFGVYPQYSADVFSVFPEMGKLADYAVEEIRKRANEIYKQENR